MSIANLFAYPFVKSLLSLPANNSRVLYYKTPFIQNRAIDTLDVLQSYKPYADEWSNAGFDVITDLGEKAKYDLVFYLCDKSKEESRYSIAKLYCHLAKNGHLIIVGRNDQNGKRLEKWAKEFGLSISIFSKSKAKIGIIPKEEKANNNALNEQLAAGIIQLKNIEDYSFYTKPSLYGWDKIDNGSRLLINSIQSNLKGHGADFGCGYGYLSSQILSKDNEIKSLHMIDAQKEAIECCQLNTENLSEGTNKNYYWDDLTNLPDYLPPLDFIIMNPPFHDGKKQAVDVGKFFIENASKKLKNNGALWMVANVHLPYEDNLKHNFRKFDKLTEEKGFKVYKAIK